MKDLQTVELEDNYRALKFSLFDRAKSMDKSYRLFKKMGRDDLAFQSLEAESQLESVITECGLEEEYKFYCRKEDDYDGNTD